MLKGLSAENAGNSKQVSGDRLFAVIDEELTGKDQEPIRLGWGRSITIVKYQIQIPVVPSVVSKECPDQGLKAFQKQQAKFFFGRERVVEDIRHKLALASFIPVIGAPGNGKSSVVRARLIPLLKASGWTVLEPIKPETKPLAELRAALKQIFQDAEEIQHLDACIDELPDS
jgi:hypothetical protein